MTDDDREFVVPADLRPGLPGPDPSMRDRERTMWLGFGLMAIGFTMAEALHSLVWAPLALVVPGAVLAVLGTLALIGGDR